jgi:hypothetical protein
MPIRIDTNGRLAAFGVGMFLWGIVFARLFLS